MNMIKCNPRTATRTITRSQSIALVQNLFRVAFATVAYIRDIFDDDCYTHSNIGATRCMKIVKKERQDVCQFVEWLERGVFDALSKQYLDIVLLQIHEGHVPKRGKKKELERGALLETYSFQVNYDKNGNAQLSCTGSNVGAKVASDKEDIRNNCSQLIRSLIRLTHTLLPLPTNRIMSMKLLYTDYTPENYEPPLFCKADDNDLDWFDDQPLHTTAGEVRTPFHEFAVDIRVRPSAENKKSNVLEPVGNLENIDATKEVTPKNNDDFSVSLVDVGGSTGNSVQVARRYVKETQEEQPDESDSDLNVPARIRRRKPSKKVPDNQVQSKKEIGAKSTGRKRSRSKKPLEQRNRKVRARRS